MTLQRSFLLLGLADARAWPWRCAGIPASDQAEIGGDFYEALLAW